MTATNMCSNFGGLRCSHPSSQGLMERAHYTMSKKLMAEIHKKNLKTQPWSKWLPRIVCRFHICAVFFLMLAN